MPSGLRSGPGMLPMRARKDARLGLSPVLTGAFRFMPSFFAEARPLAFSPPLGFLPSARCHAGVAMSLLCFSCYRSVVYKVGVWATSFFGSLFRFRFLGGGEFAA